MVQYQIKPILDWLNELRAERESPMVAIDGIGGCGKSTLANELAERLNLMSVSTDDFYRVMDEGERVKLSAKQGYERYFDWERLREHLLEPFSEKKVARYERYDWGSNKLDGEVVIEKPSLLLVEGVQAARPELQQFYDGLIYVHTSRQIATQRVRDRQENPHDMIKRWADSEDYYVDHVLDLTKFNFIISGQSGRVLATF